MMNRFTLLLIATCTSLLTYSQQYVPIPDSNALWITNWLIWDSGFPPHANYNVGLGPKGDTLIDSVQYIKLYSTSDDTILDPSDSYAGAIRESNKQVFHIPPNDSIEYLLYDFTKGVGDTLLLGYGFFPRTVTNVDSVLANNEYRKRYLISGIYHIEGIGSVKGLLHPMDGWNVALDFDVNLVCFQHNSIMHYGSTGCFVGVGVEELDKQLQINVSPNPTTSGIEINLERLEPNVKIHSITIQGIDGAMLSDVNYSSLTDKKINIDLSEFPAGMYILLIRSDNQSFRKKIIKT